MRYEVVSRDTRDTLGEGPVWIPASKELLWVDILRPAVHRLSLADGSITTREVEETIGWVLPVAGRPQVMAGFRSGFWMLDLDTGRRVEVGAPERDRPDNRLNDAKVDPFGRIWAGSKDDTDQKSSGALYRLDPDLGWFRMDDDYGVANGPTFSPDGGILYHTDSAARTIYAFDLESDGSIGNKRPWVIFPEAWGYPDGMTTDAEGHVWVAHWDGGRVSRFAPSGELSGTIELPASNITSCAFAGDGLDRLFATSSTLGHEDEPLAGALFEVDPGVTGIAPTLFAGPLPDRSAKSAPWRAL